MATDPFLSVDYTDFNRIKENFKTYLRSQTRFQDYDFEGSNFAVLLDILAYNTYYNAHYLNMVGSEMFLDSAQLRESLVSHAKELNYLPRSAKSSVARIQCTATPADNPSQILIPENQRINSVNNLNTISFFPIEDIVIVPNENGEYISDPFDVYEGRYVQEFFEVQMEDDQYKTEFIINSENVDTSTIRVDVYSNANAIDRNIFTRYERAQSLYNLNPDSEVYFIQGYRRNRYQIYFGNDVTGKRLSSGNIVKITYLDTVGADGNNSGNFQSFNFNNYTVNVETLENSSGGLNRESIESIRFNAPRHFQTQERAVTKEDYETFVLQNFLNIQSVKAFGGEEVNPPRYGKVLLACKPFGSEALLSVTEKTKIQNFLKLKNLTTEPIVIDPDYFYVEVNTKVYYDSDILRISPTTLETRILEKIVSLNLTTLNAFGADLYYSKLLKEINDVNTAILTNDTALRMIRLWQPTPNENTRLKFSYDNVIFNYSLLEEPNLFSEFPSSVRSSSFVYTKNQVQYNAFLKDDANGKMNIVTILDNGNEFLLDEVGTVNYQTGEVNILANITSYINNIGIYAKTLNKDIIINQNKFLILQSNYIDLELIERSNLE